MDRDGYDTAFWWTAGIFAVGAITGGVLLRPGPLRPASTPPAAHTEVTTAQAKTDPPFPGDVLARILQSLAMARGGWGSHSGDGGAAAEGTRGGGTPDQDEDAVQAERSGGGRAEGGRGQARGDGEVPH
jgi:hypothetical protein